MIENIPRSVARCITAAAKDVSDSIRETGSARNTNLAALASTLEKFIMGMVGPAFPQTKSAWLDKTAATSPVPVDDEAATKVKKEKEAFRQWVSENATKEMYETHIGAVDSLANILRQQYDNDETGQFAKNFPTLVEMLGAGAGPAAIPTDKPAAKPEPAPGKEDSVIPGDLGALINDRMEEAGSEIAKEEPGGEGKPKEAPEESPEGYTGGIFNKPQKGPADAGQPTSKRQNMDEFNTPVEELAKKKPEATTGHAI